MNSKKNVPINKNLKLIGLENYKMDWLAENWFWVLVLVLFVGMHMFGHGGMHGGHGKHDDNEKHDE